jgi:hypothetical protein
MDSAGRGRQPRRLGKPDGRSARSPSGSASGRPPLPADLTQAPITDTNFGARVRVPNNRVGPMALRRLYRSPAYPFDSTVFTGTTTNRLRRLICAGA